MTTDGAMLHSMSAYNPGSVIAYNWVHDVPWYGIRLDDGGPPHAGRNCSIHHNVLWNTDGLMVKGDDHLVHNNTVFSWDKPDKWLTWGVIYNDYIMLDTEMTPGFTQNAHTQTSHNVGDSISSERGTYGPVPGIVEGNLNGYEFEDGEFDVKSQLIDPENFNFCPKSGSLIQERGIGAYDADCANSWVAGITWEFLHPELPNW